MGHSCQAPRTCSHECVHHARLLRCLDIVSWLRRAGVFLLNFVLASVTTAVLVSPFHFHTVPLTRLSSRALFLALRARLCWGTLYATSGPKSRPTGSG